MLNKPPDQITVGEVVALLEGGSILTHCSKDPQECSRSDQCPTRYLWMEASNAMFSRLNQITFADLLANGKDAQADICDAST
jgi:DNA-binding IscR family transcriptional regulator